MRVIGPAFTAELEIKADLLVQSLTEDAGALALTARPDERRAVASQVLIMAMGKIVGAQAETDQGRLTYLLSLQPQAIAFWAPATFAELQARAEARPH